MGDPARGLGLGYALSPALPRQELVSRCRFAPRHQLLTLWHRHTTVRYTLVSLSHSTHSTSAATQLPAVVARIVCCALALVAVLLPPHAAVHCLLMPSASLAGAIHTLVSMAGCSCCVRMVVCDVNTQYANIDPCRLHSTTPHPHLHHPTPHLSTSASALRQL